MEGENKQKNKNILVRAVDKFSFRDGELAKILKKMG